MEISLLERAEIDTELDMFSPSQLRAARGLVAWSRERLAEASGVSVIAIKTFENGNSDPRMSTMTALRSALLKAGVIFTDATDERGPGVAFRKPTAR